MTLSRIRCLSGDGALVNRPFFRFYHLETTQGGSPVVLSISDFSREVGQPAPLKMLNDLLPSPTSLVGTCRVNGSRKKLPVQTSSLSSSEVVCISEHPLKRRERIELSLRWSTTNGPTFLKISGYGTSPRPGHTVVSFSRAPELVRYPSGEGEAAGGRGENLGTPPLLRGRSVTEEAFSYYSRLRRVKDHVLANSSDPISLADGARIAGMEATYFSDFFHRKVGLGFRDWLEQIRLALAIELLSKNNYSITFISLEVGFPSLRSFERAFRKNCGVCPAEFKKKLRPC